MVRFVSFIFCIVFSCSLGDAGKLTGGYLPNDVIELDRVPVSLPRDVKSVIDGDGTEVFVYEEDKDETVLVHAGDDAERDLRVVVDPRKHPHWIHAFVKADLKPEVGPLGTIYRFTRGSATLVSPHCLVTAGHCVFYKGERLTPTVYFGLDDDSSLTNCLFQSHAQEVAIHPEYLRTKNSHYDIAVIRIGESLPGLKLGYGSLRSYSSDDVDGLIGKEHHITGYPGETVYRMITGKGEIKKFEHRDGVAHKLYYDIDTSKGQSGSGVCKLLDGIEAPSEVVGVHTRGKEGEELNSGIFFNDEKMLPFLIGALRRMDPEWAASNLLGAADGAASGAEGGS